MAKQLNKLQLKIQGIKGNTPTWKDDVGYIAVFPGSQSNQIIIDNYTGAGASYKRRDKAIITIGKDNQNYTLASFDSLFTIVKAYFENLD